MTATNTPKTKNDKPAAAAKAKSKVLTANDFKVKNLGDAEFGR